MLQSVGPELALTYAAVFVAAVGAGWAIFRDEFYRRKYRPRLQALIGVQAGSPLSVRNRMFHRRADGRWIDSEEYSFRIQVDNVGTLRAERVELQVRRLDRGQADGRFEQHVGFFPMNLRWAGGPENNSFADGISPFMTRFCLLGRILDPQHRDRLHHTLPGVDNSQAILALDVETPPQSRVHLLAPGHYRLHLVLAAANADPQPLWLRIRVGAWDPDENRMLEDQIEITSVDESGG